MPYLRPSGGKMHKIIGHLLHNMGYDISPGGVCFGLTMMWIQARLSEKTEEQRFFSRIYKYN